MAVHFALEMAETQVFLTPVTHNEWGGVPAAHVLLLKIKLACLTVRNNRVSS